MQFPIIFVPLFFLGGLVACHQDPSQPISLTKGMVIDHSGKIQADTFFLPGQDSLPDPVITIRGHDLEVDFGGALLLGNQDPERPDLFRGLALRVEGSNITIRNLRVRGYKWGLIAEGVDSLRIIDSDFSYNYRPRLKSGREKEDLSDWLSYHQNEEDEWLRYGAGIYLKNCRAAIVKEVVITGCQNALLLSGCEEGLIYNNRFHFNSGLGIGLYRSSRNRVMHNRLDWNVRGYSHGFYARGQDSAGILCYEQSNDNVFAYNSATHSGDGFFLWAGQSTMDSGEGGCNNNLIYGNDFSHAPANGIEVTFSSNKIINNRLDDSRYGLWGGYSWKTLVLGNHFSGNDFGLAIEHGQNNIINGNLFIQNAAGIRLFERLAQPEDWGYSQNRDVSSRDYSLNGNLFIGISRPLEVSGTRRIQLLDNRLEQSGPFPSDQKNIFADGNQRGSIDTSAWLNIPEAYQVLPLPDGMPANLPEQQLRGRSYILVDEWGPYDFGYPLIWLREVAGNRYTFLLLGPEGNWKTVGGEGWTTINPKTGTFPASLLAEKKEGAESLRLELEFIGESFTDQFGRHIPKGRKFSFSFLSP